MVSSLELINPGDQGQDFWGDLNDVGSDDAKTTPNYTHILARAHQGAERKTRPFSMQEATAITVIPLDVVTFIATAGDMPDGTWKFETKLA